MSGDEPERVGTSGDEHVQVNRETGMSRGRDTDMSRGTSRGGAYVLALPPAPYLFLFLFLFVL
jgi:hypothetical protein